MVATRSRTGSLPEKRAPDVAVATPQPVRKRPRKAHATIGKRSVKQARPQPTLEEKQLEVVTGIAAAAQTKTFFDLPAEIRNEVYSLILVNDGSIQPRLLAPYFREPTLLAISRQVRSEALPIWYGDNIFEIQGSSSVFRILRSLPEHQLRCLRVLHVVMSSGSTIEYARERIKHINREFVEAGMPRTAVRFQVRQGMELKWANLNELKDMKDDPVRPPNVRAGMLPPFVTPTPGGMTVW